MKGTTRTFVIALAMATILATVATGAALAAKSGGGHHGGGGTPGGGTISLVMVNDANANGLPNFGDSVTFNVSTTVTEPHVGLKCYQGADLVYSAASGFYPGYPWPWTQIMTLWSASWAGGSADCTARLYYFSGTKVVTLTTIPVHVDA